MSAPLKSLPANFIWGVSASGYQSERQCRFQLGPLQRRCAGPGSLRDLGRFPPPLPRGRRPGQGPGRQHFPHRHQLGESGAGKKGQIDEAELAYYDDLILLR